MARIALDKTGNDHADRTLAKIDDNFKDVYAALAAITPHLGTFVCNGATAVTVTDANVTANSEIDITLKTVGGTVSPSLPYIKTITPGTGFTVAGTAGDTSTYNYAITG